MKTIDLNHMALFASSFVSALAPVVAHGQKFDSRGIWTPESNRELGAYEVSS